LLLTLKNAAFTIEHLSFNLSLLTLSLFIFWSISFSLSPFFASSISNASLNLTSSSKSALICSKTSCKSWFSYLKNVISSSNAFTFVLLYCFPLRWLCISSYSFYMKNHTSLIYKYLVLLVLVCFLFTLSWTALLAWLVIILSHWGSLLQCANSAIVVTSFFTAWTYLILLVQLNSPILHSLICCPFNGKSFNLHTTDSKHH